MPITGYTLVLAKDGRVIEATPIEYAETPATDAIPVPDDVESLSETPFVVEREQRQPRK